VTRTSSPGEWIAVTAREQRRLDGLAVERGVSNDALVESAGQSAADWIRENIPAEKTVALAGPGGNGADALVVARLLREAGVDVETFLFWPDGVPAPSAEHALRRLTENGGTAERLGDGPSAAAEAALSHADFVIDGLYGSGLSRPLEGAAAAMVESVNRTSQFVVSIDVPSGVVADAGDVAGPAVRADATLAMEFLKPAHLLFPAAALCGRVDVVGVSYPDDVRAAAAPWACVLTRAGAGRRLAVRPPTGHKGTFGHVLLVAGSAGMVGAAILAGRAALRAGAGLLTLGIPRSQAAAVHAALPEALVAALPEEAGHVTSEAVRDLEPVLDRATVLAVGPGISRDEAAGAAVVDLLHAFRGTVVLDADGLYALSRHPETIRGLRGRAILTPHPGEFALLTGTDAAEADRRRVDVACDFAVRDGVILVLKGRPTAIGLPDGRVYLNPTGNAGLAKGGSGDVLTGVIAGLAASGGSLDSAALAGPYAHGLAADLFRADGAERSLLPSDVLDRLPRAFQEMERCI
jgi:ADP-dependent NAD(P)H-hydrate dehydratase / NAD(P)H-hydrate epimerase